MKPEDKLALSFYREVEPIGKKDNVFLVRHSETGEFFVKKSILTMIQIYISFFQKIVYTVYQASVLPFTMMIN